MILILTERKKSQQYQKNFEIYLRVALTDAAFKMGYIISGAKTVPRNHVNKNTPYKNNDFMLFFAIKSIENTSKNAIQIP